MKKLILFAVLVVLQSATTTMLLPKSAAAAQLPAPSSATETYVSYLQDAANKLVGSHVIVIFASANDSAKDTGMLVGVGKDFLVLNIDGSATTGDVISLSAVVNIRSDR